MSMATVTYEVRDGRALYNGRPLRDWVPDIVEAIVARFDPVKVILFGSVADGTDGPDSDLDFLVVLDDAPLARRRDL
ncbi:MAG: nucleotidyltransferase domain-containing protein, partial [Acidimicrobiales bacterium]